jgi:toxin YoeB
MTSAGSSALKKTDGPPKKPPRGPFAAEFNSRFREDLRFWIETDRRTALRVLVLVEATLREPFAGLGKPEPLKHEMAGAWSRRITEEHRLVYFVKGNRVEFLQARYHY